MIRVKAPFSIFNGYESSEPDEITSVGPEQAVKVLFLGGDLVTREGEVVPLAEAVKILRITADTVPPGSSDSQRVEDILNAIAA